MNKIVATLVAIVAAAVLFRACAFIVDQRQFAIVFALGQIKEVISEPGLHFKLPLINNVVYLDKRILTIDTPQPDRVQTSEKKNLLVDSFVKWRINEPRRYWVSFQGSERAEAMEEIRVAVQERVKEVGVEIVDVRLKRVDFVPEISDSVFRRMEAERKRVANEQRSIGSAEGEKIRADADRQREVLLAEAYRQAQEVKGAGDAKASAIYAQSFGQNPEFFNFYRSLEAYRASFRNRSDLLVVDPSSDFFKYLKSPSPSGRPAR